MSSAGDTNSTVGKTEYPSFLNPGEDCGVFAQCFGANILIGTDQGLRQMWIPYNIAECNE